MDLDEIPESTDKTSENPIVKQLGVFGEKPREVKPLFKFQIKDLLQMEYDKLDDVFKFKNYEVSFVSCGGSISDIFRDDIIFSFESNFHILV